MNTTTSETTTKAEIARKLYQDAVAAVAEWKQAIADLHTQATDTAQQAISPTDLDATAAERVSVEMKIKVAEASLRARQADVITAAKAVVSAEADDMQQEIDEHRATIAAVDATTAKLEKAIDTATAKLRKALGDHLAQTGETRKAAEQQAVELERRQHGLRAAVAGEPTRDYFRSFDDLPEVLHPATGILSMPDYQSEFDRAEERAAHARRLDEGQRLLDEVAAELKIRDGLSVARSDYHRTDPETVRTERISAEALAAKYDEPGYLQAFDRAADYADAGSFREVVRALDRIRQSRDQADDVEAMAEQVS